MRFSRRGEPETASLKITAMIDVVFQLLIFFLVGTKFRVPEGELDAYLPEKGAPTQPSQEIPDVQEIRITLRVSQGGEDNPTVPPSVLLDDRSLGPARTSMQRLESKLREFAKDKRMREEVPIIIEAEPHLAYRWVIETLNMCRKPLIGFKKINFAASKRNAPLPASPTPPP